MRLRWDLVWSDGVVMSEKNDNSGEGAVRSPSGRTTSRRKRAMLVRYGKMGLLGLFGHSEREIPSSVSHVVIRTDRGLELGEIVSPYFQRSGVLSIGNDRVVSYCQACGPDYPFTEHGSLVRFATDQDLNEHRHLEKNAREQFRFCEELIGQRQLPMKLVEVESLFGGDRIIFYFMAEGRVDFRELVKQLAHEYQTRIEMRQVGARDEARLIADFETCGRECCCKNFLKVLQPVNMRMAKVQKATLDPSKISGRCGRLKCCLRYEDSVYSELNKKLPRRNSYVLTDQGPGTVIATHVLTQLAKIRLENGKIIAISVDEILDRNYKPPPVLERPAQRQEQGPREQQGEDKSRQATPESVDADNIGDGKKRRRRRRKKKKSSNGDAASQNSGRAGPSGGSAGGTGKDKRRPDPKNTDLGDSGSGSSQ